MAIGSLLGPKSVLFESLGRLRSKEYLESFFQIYQLVCGIGFPSGSPTAIFLFVKACPDP